MKSSLLTIAAVACLSRAAPSVPTINVDKRQFTSNDVASGNCKKVTFVFARASTEIGNMGESMGPAVCSGLKLKFSGQVACQGVGGAYSAGLAVSRKSHHLNQFTDNSIGKYHASRNNGGSHS